MKTEIIEAIKQEPGIKFPTLARSKRTGCVYVFRERTCGVVIRAGDTGGRVVWEESDFLAPITDRDRWEILPIGTKVVLEQE